MQFNQKVGTTFADKGKEAENMAVYFWKVSKRVVAVNFLAILCGCSLFSFHSDAPEEDPIEREATRVRDGWTSADQQKQINDERQDRQVQEIQYGLDEGEVVLGMNMDQVLSVWGYPRDIETAGETQAGNQKWIYNESVSRRWNLKPTRIVYFEAGKVVGWETSP